MDRASLFMHFLQHKHHRGTAWTKVNIYADVKMKMYGNQRLAWLSSTKRV